MRIFLIILPLFLFSQEEKNQKISEVTVEDLTRIVRTIVQDTLDDCSVTGEMKGRAKLNLDVEGEVIARIVCNKDVGIDEDTQAENSRLVLPQTQDNQYPFSDVVRVGNILYISGIIGVNENDNLVMGGLVEESHQIFRNLKKILDIYEINFSNIFKCTVFIDDIDKWGEFNSVYTKYFQKPYPARSALGADGLALGAEVELECNANLVS